MISIVPSYEWHALERNSRVNAKEQMLQLLWIMQDGNSGAERWNTQDSSIAKEGWSNDRVNKSGIQWLNGTIVLEYVQ
jgi:hypothetical protein